MVYTLTASPPLGGVDSQPITIYFIVCVGVLYMLLHILLATTIIRRMGHGIMFLGLPGPYIHLGA